MWYEVREKKKLIMERNIAPEVEAYINLTKHLERLGWAHILILSEVIFPELVKVFYANVIDKDKFSSNFIEFTVRG